MERNDRENKIELNLIETYLVDMEDNYEILSKEEVDVLSIAKDEGLIAQEILQSSNETINDEEKEYLEETISKGNEASGVLVTSLLPLVVFFAKKNYQYATDRSISQFLDLIQVGNMGAMKAVEKFDYTRGNKLSTYATWWIKQAIRRDIISNGKSMRTSEHMINNIRRVRKAQAELTNKLGRAPCDEEISQLLDIPVQKIVEYIDFDYQSTSLDSPISDNERTLKDIIPTKGVNVEEEVTTKVDAEQIIKYIILEILSPRESDVISLRYGLNGLKPHTYKEIATIHGISNERAKQIESESLVKIRKKDLDIYL